MLIVEWTSLAISSLGIERVQSLSTTLIKQHEVKEEGAKMTESSEILYCPKCKKRESFLMSGSGTKGICLACETEVVNTVEAKVKAVSDLMFEFFADVSNGGDK